MLKVIELIYSGLRAGEKMYEELLINSDSIATENSKIFKAKESYISKDKLLNKIEMIAKYIEKVEEDNILKIVKELVPEWEKKMMNKFIQPKKTYVHLESFKSFFRYKCISNNVYFITIFK